MKLMVDIVLDNLEDEVLRGITLKIEEGYPNLGLTFNPFPAAGIPKVPNIYTLDEETKKSVLNFLHSTYSIGTDVEDGEYAGLTIVADYGMGKTHLMKYIIYVLQQLNEKSSNSNFSAVTCFIDRPEDSPQKVIYKILDQIGSDTIRKYLWMVLIKKFNEMPDFRNRFRSQMKLVLESDDWNELFTEPTKSNYLDFLAKFTRFGGNIQKLQDEARKIIKTDIIDNDDVLSEKYFNLLFPSKKNDASWDILIGSKSSSDLDKKEVKFLNSIVKILQQNDIGMLYLFIDEFEDVTKISRPKLTDYLLTLNTLINNERKWAVVITVTEEVLNKIKLESPPLYDRLTTYIVRIQQLNLDHAQIMIAKYLNLARNTQSQSIDPFSTELIQKMLDVSKGNYRSFIRLAHRALEYAATNKQNPPLQATLIEQIKDVN